MSTIRKFEELVRGIVHAEPGSRLEVWPASAQRLRVRVVVGGARERESTDFGLVEALAGALQNAPRTDGAASALRDLVEIVEKIQAADEAFLVAHRDDRIHDARRAREDRDAALDALRGFWSEKQNLVREAL